MSATTSNWIHWDPIGSALADIDLGPLESVLSALDTAAETLGGVGEAVALVEAILAEDPIRAAFAAVGQVYSGLINGLEQTDIYALPLLPHSWMDLLHPYTTTDALVDVQSALADRMDPNRPLFGPGDAFASVTILVGADNWTDFRRFVKLFGEIFSAEQASKWARFADLRLQFDKFERAKIPRPARGSQGETWDWYKTNWMELVPPLGDLLRRLRDLADSLVGAGMGLGRAIQDLADILEERIDYVRQLINELARVAEFFARLLELAPNAAVLLSASPDGGTQEYARALESAANRPEHKLTAGITLLVGTANPVAYLEILKKMLGMQVTSIRSDLGQAQEAL